MTAQMGEIIKLDGEEHSMCAEPLATFLQLIDDPPEFQATSTALWRGYIGTWEIIDSRLYLIKLEGNLENNTLLNLDALFPGYPDRVFAHWYSGQLRVPMGKLLNYVHAGFGSVYERDNLIQIENGLVVNTTTRMNGKSRNSGGSDGYQIAAAYVFDGKESCDPND